MSYTIKMCHGDSGVGFAAGDVAVNRLPGWVPHSYGYHGDDGCSFESSGTGKPYGPVYATGEHNSQTQKRVCSHGQP